LPPLENAPALPPIVHAPDREEEENEVNIENAPALPPIVHASDREEENEVNNLSHHIEYLEYGEEDDRD